MKTATAEHISPPTRFGLIRHAATAWNMEKRIQGQKDTPLTDDGRMSADRWGKILAPLNWDRILTSDMDRAVKTAQRINAILAAPIEKDSRLREQDWGDWVGMTVPQVDALFRRMPAEQAGVGWGFCPPGGESRAQTLERGQQALVDAAGRWPGESILVVTHNGMIRCLLKRCLGFEFAPSEPRPMRPEHVHLLACRNRTLVVEKVDAIDLTRAAR